MAGKSLRTTIDVEKTLTEILVHFFTDEIFSGVDRMKVIDAAFKMTLTRLAADNGGGLEETDDLWLGYLYRKRNGEEAWTDVLNENHWDSHDLFDVTLKTPVKNEQSRERLKEAAEEIYREIERKVRECLSPEDEKAYYRIDRIRSMVKRVTS